MSAFSIDPAALAEYELVDELRRLPIRDARRLARAAATATGEPVTAEQLDSLTAGDWENLIGALEDSDPLLKGLREAGWSLSSLAASDVFEDQFASLLDELDADNVVDVLRRMYDSDEIDDVSDKLPDDVRQALKAMGEDEAQAVKALTPTKLFFVYQVMPRERGKRKRRVFRYVALATGPSEAIEAVRRDRPKMLHQCEWRAEEAGDACAAIDWELEK